MRLLLRFCASCAFLRPSLLVLFAAFAGHLAAQPAPVLADPTTGALFRPGAATFASYNNLLTTSQAAGLYLTIDAAAGTYLPINVAANSYQPLAASLTSWSSIARATGFDTFVATPSSANLASLVTGETGTGALVFGTSPTLTTPTLGAATATSLTLSGNISSAAWTTSGVRLKGVAATLTDTTSTGTVAAAYTDVLGGNTIAASNATTFTDYITAYFRDPTAGSLVTMTNKWALGSESLRVGTSTPMTVSTAGAITANSLTGRTTTDLTLAGGSSGASLVLGHGASGVGLLTVLNTNDTRALSIQQSTNTATGHIGLFSQSLYLGQNYYYSSGHVIPNSLRTTGTIVISTGATANSGNIDFNLGTINTQPATLARLTGTGNLLIGTTTDMSGSGGLKVAGTTAASSTTTGALQVAGGVGVAGAGYFGGVLNVAGDASFSSGTFAMTGGAGSYGLTISNTSATTRLTTSFGGSSLGVRVNAAGADQLTVSGSAVNIPLSTAASSSTSGALTVGNGTAATNVAIGGGNVNAGGSITAGNTLTVSTAAASLLVATGATEGDLILADSGAASGSQAWNLQSDGGVLSVRRLGDNFGTVSSTPLTISAAGAVNVTASTASTGVGTGALQVAGGIYAGAASVFGADTSFAGTSGTLLNIDVTSGFANPLLSLKIAGATKSVIGVAGAAGNIVSGSAVNSLNIRANELNFSGDSGTTRHLTIATTGAATFAGAVNISASGQANAKATITNTDTASYAHLDLSSSSAQNSSLYQFGSTYTTSGRYIQGSTMLEAGGAGGLNFATSAATPIRFYTNGDNVRLTIDSAGAATFAGAVSLSTAGTTVSIKSGTNAAAGTVTLVAGNGTITSTAIDVNTVIVMSIKTKSGSFDHAPSVVVAAGSATIDGHNSDDSTYNWIALKVN